MITEAAVRLDENPDGIEPVSDETVIWRYLTLDKFLDLIVKERLYFHAISQLPDQFEGGRRKGGFVLDTPFSSPEQVAVPEASYASCWSLDTEENYALWKIYLGSAGVAIKTTVGKLKEAISFSKVPESFPLYIVKVHYGFNESGERLRLLTTKTIPYAYEKELRLVVYGEKDQQGLYGSVDPLKLIEEIRLSPFSHNYNESIQTALEKVAPELKSRFVNSEIDEK